MKNIFKNHSEAVLISLAVVFLVLVIGFLYMTIQLVIPQVNRTLVSPQFAGSEGFDIPSADTINYKGISTSTSPTTVVTPPPATTTSATTTSKTATTTGG